MARNENIETVVLSPEEIAAVIDGLAPEVIDAIVNRPGTLLPVRTDAAEYAEFIADVLGRRGIDVNRLSFAEVVESTFEAPKAGLGITAFRNSDFRKAAKAARKADADAAAAAARAERDEKKRAKALAAKIAIEKRLADLGLNPDGTALAGS